MTKERWKMTTTNDIPERCEHGARWENRCARCDSGDQRSKDPLRYGYKNMYSVALRDVYEKRFVNGDMEFTDALALMDAIREIERLTALEQQ